MLKLWNKDRVKAAAEVLQVKFFPIKLFRQLMILLTVIFLLSFQSVSSKVLDALDNRPVSVRLKGLVKFPPHLTFDNRFTIL